MIKRFSKKQGSKQGVILLTVVFILAMAVIFISACMVMTQATRNRLYWKAEQSQARLTVTSAAEAFYQALEVGDFQEGQLKKLAKAGASGILMTAKDGSGNYLPGMSTSPENCTTLSLKAKDADCSEIYAYLVTTIDGESEKVKITFKVKKKPKVYGLFGNPVDYNGMASNLNFDDFGYANGLNPDDNFLVIRDGGYMQDSSSQIYSNIVFTAGDIGKFQANLHGSDFIFLGSATLGLEASVDDGAGGYYFVNTPGSSSGAFSKSFGYDQMNASGPVVFANRTANYKLNNVGTASPVYSIDVSGSSATWNSSNIQAGNSFTEPSAETLQTVYDKTSKYVSEDFVNSIGEFPTTEQAFAQIKLGDDPLPATAPSSFKEYTLDGFKTKYGNSSITTTPKIVGDDNGDGVVENPNIKITTGGSIGNDTGSTGTDYVFLLDGSIDYVIYLTGDTNLYQAVFAVYGPNSDHQQVFVLQSGVDLVISNQNYSSKCQGFISVPRSDDSASAANYLKYVLEGKLIGEMTSKPSGGKYSSYYDSKCKPTIYILGAANNQVKMNCGTVVEAYMGLFNPAGATTTSGVTCYNTSQYIYGRMMFDGFTTADGGNVNMPYCPGPNNGGDKPDVELYKFGYSVVSVDYYYVD